MLFRLPVAASSRPAWIADPKAEDSIYVYSLGHARGMPSPEAAEREAYRDALLRLLRAYRSDIDDPDRWPMQNAAIVRGAIHHEQDGDRHACWLQVMWPKHERVNLVEQLTEVDRIEQRWRQAQTLAAEGKPAESRELLIDLLGIAVDQPATENLLPAVQFQIARTWHADNRPLEARQWYERLIRQAPDDPLAHEAAGYLEQLPPPSRMWPMHARFAGGPVGLLTVRSEGGDRQPFGDLNRVLAQACRAAGMESRDLGRTLSADALTDAFDNPASVLRRVPEADLTVLLMVAVEIDPGKRGTTTMAFGAEIPVPDTRVRLYVLDVSNGTMLYADSFPAMTGSRSAANLAENLANMLIERHLLPNCPGVKRDRSERIATTVAPHPNP